MLASATTNPRGLYKYESNTPIDDGADVLVKVSAAVSLTGDMAIAEFVVTNDRVDKKAGVAINCILLKVRFLGKY